MGRSVSFVAGSRFSLSLRSSKRPGARDLLSLDVAECSVLSRGPAGSGSRHLGGVEAALPRGAEVLRARRELELLNVRVVPKDVADDRRAGCDVLRLNGYYAGLLEILLAVERLLRHVLAVDRAALRLIVGTVYPSTAPAPAATAADVRRTVSVVLLRGVVLITKTRRRVRARHRTGVLQALRRALRYRLEDVPRHARRRAVHLLEPVDAIRVPHEDRSALGTSADYVPHALTILRAQTLTRTRQPRRRSEEARRAVQIGNARPAHARQLPAAHQVRYPLGLHRSVQALVVVRTLES